MNRKTRVAVLYGGKSGEHEVSLKSAASVLRHIDRERFEPVPVSIDKQGRRLVYVTCRLQVEGRAVFKANAVFAVREAPAPASEG